MTRKETFPAIYYTWAYLKKKISVDFPGKYISENFQHYTFMQKFSKTFMKSINILPTFRCNVAREDIRQAHETCRVKNPGDRDERRGIEHRFCLCVRDGTGKTEAEMSCQAPAKRQG
jgi:hypothetical protein